MKYTEFLKAKELRSEGKSVGEIAKILSVAKSSVSVWVRDVEMTEEQKEVLKKKKYSLSLFGDTSPVRKKYLNLRKEYQEEGRELAKKYKENSLFVMGCSLYWAEGSKSRNAIQFVNSDASMMKVFKKFLFEFFEVKTEDVSFCFHTHKDNEKTLEEISEYWKNELEIKEENLRKNQIDKRVVTEKKGRKTRLHNGIARLSVYSSKKTQMLYGAIQELSGFENKNWLG